MPDRLKLRSLVLRLKEELDRDEPKFERVERLAYEVAKLAFTYSHRYTVLPPGTCGPLAGAWKL
jgi:hypothetical protein